MAKKKEKISAPSSLTMDLNAPGMTAMHRAGLGGLAATLYAIDPETSSDFRWSIRPTEITLDFGKPENARSYLKRLFEFAFQIDRNGLIRLPGQESPFFENPPEIQACLQDGLLRTFLQHGPSRDIGNQRSGHYDYDGHSIKYVYREFLKYDRARRCDMWKALTDNKGLLSCKQQKVKGQIYPGAIERHGLTMSQPIELVLPLCFAIVGTLSLPIDNNNDNNGVLIVPYVDNLKTFAKNRSRMTPMTVDNCFIGGVGDAALQFEVRCQADEEAETADTLGCDVIRFRPMPWATRQKSRTETLSVDSLDPQVVGFYRRILGYLPPRVLEKTQVKKEGRGKNAVSETITENYWVDSVVRPFIADNLARGRLWFEGFARWICSNEPASKQQYWEKVGYERKGIRKMVNDKECWKQEELPAGARSLVLAVRDALQSLYKTIETDRKEREYDKWRIAFSGAKTAERFRYTLTNMFSRAKFVPALHNHWWDIVELMTCNWELARDLALVGLACEARKEGTSDSEQNTAEELATEESENNE